VAPLLSTTRWRDALAYKNSGKVINTKTANIDDIWDAAQEVYFDYPELLNWVKITLGK
jgi:hypothetical protein